MKKFYLILILIPSCILTLILSIFIGQFIGNTFIRPRIEYRKLESAPKLQEYYHKLEDGQENKIVKESESEIKKSCSEPAKVSIVPTTKMVEVKKERNIEHVKKIEDQKETLHRIQVGAFSTKENAEKFAKELENKEILSYINTKEVQGKTLYRVQSGSFKNKENAIRELERLKSKGLEVFITKE